MRLGLKLSLRTALFAASGETVQPEPDVTAPVISGPVDEANGSDGATLSVTTDEGNGTLYVYISTSATPPSVADLKSGSGAALAGTQAVTTVGVQNVTINSGLTSSTAYFAHFLHTDSAGNNSNIATGDGFTTGAEVGFTDPPTLTRTSTAGTNPMDWSGDYPNIDPDNDYIAMRFRVNGGAWTNETDVLFTTAMYLDYLDNGSFSFTWPIFDGTTFAGGAVVEVQEAIKRGATYYWGNIISDTMASAVSYTQGGTLTSVTSATTQTFNNVAFAAGLPVLVISNFANAGGTTDASPTSVTLTPSGGGAAINLVERIEQIQSTTISRSISCWTGSANIAAGNYNIVITRPALARSNVVTYGVLLNANATPTSALGNTPTNNSNTTHATPSVTVPTNGLALAAMYYSTGSAVSVNAPAVEIVEIAGGDSRGICLASRTSTGTVEFVNATGTYAKFIIAWGPA